MHEKLQERNICLFIHLPGVGVPDTGLNLSDVGAAQKEHAEPALADTAADGVGELPGQQGLVEGEAPPLIMAADGQLTVQAFG